MEIEKFIDVNKSKIIVGLIVLTSFLIIFSVKLQGQEDWTIEGNRVYVEDSNVYISAFPHTITGNEYVYFNFTSKIYEGNIDVVFGFNTTTFKPRKIEIYKPEYETITHSFSCDFEDAYFNYTLNPKHFWCYKNYEEYNEEKDAIGLYLIYEHNFEWGDLETKIAYWNETYLKEWQDYSSNFDSIYYNFGGMNKWFYAKNIPIQKDKNYYFRVYLDFPINKGFSSSNIDEKYWMALKPSGESISQAISNNHLYALDPWVNSTGSDVGLEYLDEGIKSYWRLNETSGETAYDALEVRDINIGNSGGWTSGLIANALDNGIVDTPFTTGYNPSTDGTGEFTASLWTYYDGTQGFDYIISNRPNTGAWENGCFYIQFNNDQINFGVRGTNIRSSGNHPLPVNAWSMITLTVAQNNACLYINGTQVECEDPGTIDLNCASGTVSLLGIPGNPTGDYNSTVDEMGMWNRSLNTTEILGLYNNGLGISYGEPAPPSCVFSGTVKDENNNLINGSIIIINQDTSTLVTNLSTNFSGGWQYSVSGTGNYLIVAYDSTNSSRDGDADPFVVCS